MPSCEERIYSNDYADILTDFSPSEENPGIAVRDFCYTPISSLFGAFYVNRRSLVPLSVSEYTYRFLPKLYAPMKIYPKEEKASAFQSAENVSFPLLRSGILQMQQPPLSLTGRHVIIGIADSGIDYTLPAFRRKDGSSRILAIWDQTIPAGIMEENEGEVSYRNVPYGTIYTREDINRALENENPYITVPSRDETGHGSAMASAAGGKTEDWIYGGAIDAEFVIVKLKEAKPYLRQFYHVSDEATAYSEVDLMLAMRFIDSFCVPFEKPLIFCLGVGSNMGPHDGSSLFSEYINELALKRSRALVVCSGNEGNHAAHFSGSGNVDAEIRVGEGENGFSLEIWGSIPEIFSVSVITPGGESTSAIRVDNNQSRSFTFIYEETAIEIDSELAEQSSGKALMLIRFNRPTPGVWRIQVRDAGEFNMWLPVKEFLSGETYFLRPNPDTTLTEPGYAEEIITVSGYQDENGAFWGESGRGYAADGEVKPDIAAPAVDIPVSSPAYETATGSSLSVAITAGATAQFLEWAIVRSNDLYIKGREIKTYLQRGAARDAGLTYPNEQWGYGKLDLQGVFEALRRM